MPPSIPPLVLPDLPQCEYLAKQIVKVVPIIIYNIPKQDILPIDLCGLVKSCDVDCCSQPLPEQVRLSGTSDNAIMFVAWVQKGNWTGSVVEYGVSPTSMSPALFPATTVHTYHSGNWKGFIYNTTLTGLKQNTKYFYRVGSNAGGFSKTFSFRTFVNSGYESTTTTWAVIGDMGTNYQSDNTIKRLKDLVAKDEIVGILHNGDIAYADGVQRRWDDYGRKVQDITANTQYQTVPGNHEMAIVTYLGLEGYKNRWFMPYDFPIERPGGQEAYWYTFTRGPLRVIGLNSESHMDVSLISPDQLAWLKTALAEAQRTRDQHPWLFVMLHRPLYCTSTRHTECGTFAQWLRDWLEELFHEYKVDLVITAHMHNYERTTPLYKSQAQPEGSAPVYIVNGAAGCREGLSSFADNPPAWSASRIHDMGYGLMSVTMDSLSWKFYISADNSVADSFVLTKKK